MKNQLHAYADDELYAHCSLLAREMGLSNSSYLKMLISKAWKERNDGGVAKISESVNKSIVDGFSSNKLGKKHGHQKS